MGANPLLLPLSLFFWHFPRWSLSHYFLCSQTGPCDVWAFEVCGSETPNGPNDSQPVFGIGSKKIQSHHLSSAPPAPSHPPLGAAHLPPARTKAESKAGRAFEKHATECTSPTWGLCLVEDHMLSFTQNLWFWFSCRTPETAPVPWCKRDLPVPGDVVEIRSTTSGKGDVVTSDSNRCGGPKRHKMQDVAKMICAFFLVLLQKFREEEDVLVQPT